MTNEERVKQESPLSREGWIMFLSGEIAELENEAQQYSNVFLAIISLVVVAMSLIISSLFSTVSANIPEPNKAAIFHSLYNAFAIISILSVLFFIYSLYQILKFLIHRKNAKIMKDIRNDIINETLIDTNEIRERWRNLMQ